MPIDSQIPLQVQTPQGPSPLQTISALMQMRAQTADLETMRARAEEQRALARLNQIKVEKEQRDAADQNTIQNLLKTDPEVAHAIGRGDVSVLNGLISPDNQASYGESIAKAIKEHALASENDLKLYEHRAQIASEALDGFSQMESDAARASAWPGTMGRLKAEGILDGIEVPGAISGKMEEIRALAARAALFRGMNKAALDLRKEQQPLDIAQAAEDRTATEFEIGLPAKQAEAATKAAVAGATFADPRLLTPEQQATDIRSRETIAAQDARAAAERAVQVRGQDVSAATQRRGQDIGAETTRRGQDITGTAKQAQDKALPIVNQIDELSKKINTGSGISAKVSGLLRSGAARANYDNDVAQYKSLIEGAIPLVARALGHTGVLTQQDVDSTRNMFPKVGDSDELAAKKMKQVRAVMAGHGSSGAESVDPVFKAYADKYFGGDIEKAKAHNKK